MVIWNQAHFVFQDITFLNCYVNNFQFILVNGQLFIHDFGFWTVPQMLKKVGHWQNGDRFSKSVHRWSATEMWIFCMFGTAQDRQNLLQCMSDVMIRWSSIPASQRCITCSKILNIDEIVSNLQNVDDSWTIIFFLIFLMCVWRHTMPARPTGYKKWHACSIEQHSSFPTLYHMLKHIEYS